MTNHLPECHTSMIPDFHNERWICICDQLRACEQRVLSLNPVGLGVLIAQRARERALDAAREALDALPTEQTVKEGVSEFWVEINHAVAAIDALKEKP